MKIFGERCLVKEIKKQETDANEYGVIVPGSKDEPTYTGVVLKTGEGAMLDDGTIVPMHVKPGDKIVYNVFSGSPIQIKDETFLILNERDILAILED